MYLYGASGHSKVVIDAIQSSSNNRIEAIFDDNPKFESILNVPVINTKAAKILNSFDFIITIGDNKIRQKIVRKLDVNYISVIHSKSIVANSSCIGKGTVVLVGAIVNPDAKINDHCIINSGAVIEHDCILNDFVHVSPNASLAGNVIVGEGTHIGINATIIQGIKIGKWATIGAGTVVINDVPDYAVVVGNPGKIIKYKEYSEL
jgi:acetyltransferase EpsM